MSNSQSSNDFPDHWVLTGTCLLALLYVGRDFLEPVALATILSLLISPLVRRFRKLGLGHKSAALIAVLMTGVLVIGAGIVLVVQVATVAADLPRYKVEIRSKLDQFADVTLRPIEKWESELKALDSQSPDGETNKKKADVRSLPGEKTPPVVSPVGQARPSTIDMLPKLLTFLGHPIGQGAVVLLLMVFILLEHRSLKERAIRLAARHGLARTVQALADTGEGISRFFFSQLVVNLAFAITIGLALWLLGAPHAALWGALSGLLRFVPYLGVPTAGIIVAVFSAAVDPGWSLFLSALAVFIGLELLVAHVVEPHVYGRSTGLTPLAVILAALFWGILWGPLGLLLSTPLTLCLVVAGRHVGALAPLTILLSDSPGVSQGQRLYQRALTGEHEEIIQEARTYLKQNSFAKYCDYILVPGLELAGIDLNQGQITEQQQDRVREAIVSLLESLVTEHCGHDHRHHARVASVLDATVGAHLRQLREAHLGRWQGSLDVAFGSVVLCAGFPSERDALFTELLAMSLRDTGVDARTFSLGRNEDQPETDKTGLVSTIFLAFPVASDLERWRAECKELRVQLPHVMLVAVKLAQEMFLPNEAELQEDVDFVLRSASEAVAFVAETNRRS